MPRKVHLESTLIAFYMAFFCDNLQMIEEKPQVETLVTLRPLAEINLVSWQVSYTRIYYLIGHFS